MTDRANENGNSAKEPLPFSDALEFWKTIERNYMARKLAEAFTGLKTKTCNETNKSDNFEVKFSCETKESDNFDEEFSCEIETIAIEKKSESVDCRKEWMLLGWIILSCSILILVVYLFMFDSFYPDVKDPCDATCNLDYFDTIFGIIFP